MIFQRARIIPGTSSSLPPGTELWVEAARPRELEVGGYLQSDRKVDESGLPERVPEAYQTSVLTCSCGCADGRLVVLAAHVELLPEFAEDPPAPMLEDWLAELGLRSEP